MSTLSLSCDGSLDCWTDIPTLASIYAQASRQGRYSSWLWRATDMGSCVRISVGTRRHVDICHVLAIPSWAFQSEMTREGDSKS